MILVNRLKNLNIINHFYHDKFDKRFSDITLDSDPI